MKTDFWTESNGIWVIEASDLAGAGISFTSDLRCPSPDCGTPDFGEETIDWYDSEIAGWRMTCKKGHRILIIND
jgi:hypothetical protein